MEPCIQNLFRNLISPVSEKLLLILLALPATPHFFTPPCTETLCRNYRSLQLPILLFPPKFAAVRPLYPPPHPLLKNLMVVFSPQWQDWLTALRRLTNPSSWKHFASPPTPRPSGFSPSSLDITSPYLSPLFLIFSQCVRIGVPQSVLGLLFFICIFSRQPCADDHHFSLPIPDLSRTPDASSLLSAISTWICNRHLI